MKLSRVVACGMLTTAASIAIFAGGCSSSPALPEGGVDAQTLGQKNAAGQMQVMQTRAQVDPAMKQHNGQPNQGMEAGQAAAMQARMAAEGQHH